MSILCVQFRCPKEYTIYIKIRMVKYTQRQILNTILCQARML